MEGYSFQLRLKPLSNNKELAVKVGWWYNLKVESVPGNQGRLHARTPNLEGGYNQTKTINLDSRKITTMKVETTRKNDQHGYNEDQSNKGGNNQKEGR
ncbi:hypothetical protein Tco_1316234 [Tanacetum coccineum]